MALSPQDRKFYEDKLSLGSFISVFAATAVLGAIGLPGLNYMQDVSAGQTARWTFEVFADWAMIGCMVGLIIATFMYLGFKFLLQMGWLPARH